MNITEKRALPELLARDAPIVDLLRASGPVLTLAHDDARRIVETFDALVKERQVLEKATAA
jgi:hypothetical protein